MELVEYKLPQGMARFVRLTDGSLMPVEVYRQILWYQYVYAKNILLTKSEIGWSRKRFEDLESPPSHFLAQMCA